MKKALITGITGQDGAYLAEFLLKKGYEQPDPHHPAGAARRNLQLGGNEPCGCEL